MADFYLGEIRMFACNYAPPGWHICDGSLLNMQQNAALYALLGTLYGGDGKTTFALPDLRGRTMAGLLPTNPSFQKVGTAGGSETETLSPAEMPPHTHTFGVKNAPATGTLAGEILANPVGAAPTNTQVDIYNASAATTTTLNPATISTVGGNVPHNNMQPYTTVNFCIAVQGLFPSRN